jgi:hypothetical protein
MAEILALASANLLSPIILSLGLNDWMRFWNLPLRSLNGILVSSLSAIRLSFGQNVSDDLRA